MSQQGKIKKLVLDRGFGFIAADNGTEYFFHRSAVGRNGAGFEQLSEGQSVSFDTEDSSKGPRATNIHTR